MDTDQMPLWKQLLKGRLRPSQRLEHAKTDLMNAALTSLWDYNITNTAPEEAALKEAVWKRIVYRTRGAAAGDKRRNLFLRHATLVAACIAGALLVAGALWFTFAGKDLHGGGPRVEIIASQGLLHLLPDSSRVWMEAGAQLSYKEDFTQREVYLTGTSLFEVETLEEKAPFTVHLENAHVTVTGTTFLVRQQEDLTEVSLYEGGVHFTAADTTLKVALRPLQKVVYDAQEAQLHVQSLPRLHWENGRYRFDNLPLSEVLEALKEIYRTPITLEQPALGRQRFTGGIRYNETLEEVLEKICFVLNLQQETINHIVILK